MLEELASAEGATLLEATPNPSNPGNNAERRSQANQESLKSRSVPGVEKQQSSSEKKSLSSSSLRQKFVWIRSERERQCSRCGSKYHYHWKCPEGRSCVKCSNPGIPSRCQVVIQRTQIMRELKDPGKLQQLDRVYLGLMQDGHRPSLECYTVYMKGLAASGRFQEAEMVLTEMEEDGVEPDAIAHNVVINAWSSAERMDEAMRIFELMKRNQCAAVTSTFNTLIKGFGLTRQPKRAMELLREMSRTETAKPNARTYNMLINVWCRQKKVDEAKKVIRMMKAAGFSPDVVSYNTLAKLYGELGQPSEAERVIKEMLNAYVRPNERTYAMVITSFCQAGYLDRAVNMIETMRIQGVNPNLPIFNILIKAYAGLLDPAAMDKVFQLMESHGLTPDVSSFGVIMNVWCTAGLVDDSRALMRTTREYNITPDVIAYGTLAKGYARYGRPAEAASLLEEMVDEGLKPNVVTYTTVISGWCSVPNMEAAMQVLEDMRRAGVSPNLTTYHTLIWGFNEARQPHKAEAVLDLVEKGGLVPDYHCLDLVAQAWSSVGAFSDAQRVLSSRSINLTGVDDSRFFPEKETEDYDMVSRFISVAGSDWRQALSVDGLGSAQVGAVPRNGIGDSGIGMQIVTPRGSDTAVSTSCIAAASTCNSLQTVNFVGCVGCRTGCRLGALNFTHFYLRPLLKICCRVQDDSSKRRLDWFPPIKPCQRSGSSSHAVGGSIHFNTRVDVCCVILEPGGRVRRSCTRGQGCLGTNKPLSWDYQQRFRHAWRVTCADYCSARSHLIDFRQYILRDNIRCKLRSLSQRPCTPLWKLGM